MALSGVRYDLMALLVYGVMITLTLPEPPSSNRYWRKYNNRMVLSQEAQGYKNQVIMLCAGLDPLQGEIEITIKWFRKRKQGDLDNRIKIVLDCLQWRLYENDSQIVALHAYRFEDKDNPRVEITCCNFPATDLH